MKVAANSSTLVPNFVAPPGPKPNEPLNRLTGPLRFRLLEDRENGMVFDDRTAQITIATPEDYLTDFFEIAQARYIPANQPDEKTG